MADVDERTDADGIFWLQLMGKVESAYEEETGRPWVPGSAEVRAWVEKTFPRTRPGKAEEGKAHG